jgi:hypothetical protein
MMKILVKGKPGDYFVGGNVQWDGQKVGTVLEVKDNGDAVCEVNNDVYEKMFELKFVSMGCSFSDIN